MICPNCQNENREGARFCDACGTPLVPEIASAIDVSGSGPASKEDEVIDASEAIEPQETVDDLEPSEPKEDAGDQKMLEFSGAHDVSEAPEKPEVVGASTDPDTAKPSDTLSSSAASEDLDKTLRIPLIDPADITCDLGESLVSVDFEPPKPDWHDGGTMQMPAIKEAPVESNRDFRASSTVEQKHGARKVALVVGAFVVVALAVAAIVTYQMEIWGGKSVPDVSGMTQEEATSTLEDKGFTVRATSVKSDDAEGLVLLEDPEANSRQPEGSEVVIHITVPRSMPDVVGKTEDEAKSLIAAEDLSNVTYTKVSSDEAEGTVLSSSVDAGTRLRGTTAIELEIAQPYTVPDISGQSLSEAQQSINAEGLSYQVAYTYTEQYPDGTILGTTPNAGEKVKGGSIVAINVTKMRSTELLAATRDLLASGSTVTVGGVSYTVSSLDSVQYVGGNQTSFSMTATPFVSLFGEKLSGASRSVSGTITWTDDNDVSSISS